MTELITCVQFIPRLERTETLRGQFCKEMYTKKNASFVSFSLQIINGS